MVVNGLTVGSSSELLRRAASWEKEAIDMDGSGRSGLPCRQWAGVLFGMALEAEARERTEAMRRNGSSCCPDSLD